MVAGTGAGAAKDSDTCFNIMLGNCAGKALCAGDDNVLIGNAAGCSLSTGNQNVIIGKCAGKVQVGASCNIFLGHYAGAAVQEKNGKNISQVITNSFKL